MAYLTKEQVTQIIQNAPPGTSPSGIVAALRKQGHTLEGHPAQVPFKQSFDEDKKGQLGVGFGKSVLNTIKGASEFGEKGIKKLGRFLTPKSLEKKFGFEETEDTGASRFQSQVESKLGVDQGSLTAPTNQQQKIGFALGEIAQFFIPGTSSVKAAKAIKAGRGAKLVTKAAAEAGLVGSISAAQEGEMNQQVVTNALVASAFPFVGAAFSALRRGTSSGARGLGERVLKIKIKPSRKDVADGFKEQTLSKYRIAGSLDDMLTKTQVEINKLSDQVNKIIKESPVRVNMTQAFEETAKKLTGSPSNFGNNTTIKRQLNALRDELTQVTPIGVQQSSSLLAQPGRHLGDVDLALANTIKRGAGTKGAWVSGLPDKDANAIETVYTTFYQTLRKKIEAATPGGQIRKLNKEISELIPVSNAIIRRKPVAERQSSIGLVDAIATAGAVFNPSALLLLGANNLQKSGGFADFLFKVADKLKQTPDRVLFRNLRERLVDF